MDWWIDAGVRSASSKLLICHPDAAISALSKDFGLPTADSVINPSIH